MCPCFTTLVLLAIIVGLVYLFLVWNFGYWKKRGIKEAAAYPLFGSFPSQFTQKRNYVYDVDDIYKKYKKDENFVGVYGTRIPQLLALSPEYAHRIYVNDFKNFHDNDFSADVDKKRDVIFANNPFILTGEEWKERRAEITPGLTANRVKTTFPVTEAVCKSFADYIGTQMKMTSKDKGLDAKELCLRYTTEVVSDCVLGIKAASFSAHPTPIYAMSKKMFDQSYIFILYTVFTTLLPWLKKIYIARFIPKEVESFFFDIMQQAISLRSSQKNLDRTDFLNYILQLQEKKNLTIPELMSHTITFLSDGFETTSSVLAHTLLLLARYPETQTRLLQEIESQGSKISFENLGDMPYLDACIHESLRIFSPLLVGRKLCTAPYEFVNKNGVKVQLNVGDLVLVPVHSLHHDPEIYEKPEEFIPERFLEENGGVKKYREQGAFFGFGDGPRVCLGMRFAMTQMKSALVEVLRNFEVKVNPRTRQDNYLDETNFMALLKGGIWLDFEPKN